MDAATTADAPSAATTTDDVEPPAFDLAAIASELAAVEAALVRLDDGAYGRCDVCGQPIDDDVLAARPTASSCSAHLARGD